MTVFTQRPFIINFLLFFTALFFVSCEPKNDENLVPSYLHIEKIDVSTDYQQGTPSSQITDAWIYIGEELIGSFELPATIPILTEGTQTLKIRPGIKLNGISNIRTAYPFYTEIEREVNFIKDSLITISSATVTYESTTIFPWMESFDISGMSMDTTSKSNVRLSKTNDPDLIFTEEGNSYSGMVTMTNDTALFEAATTETFEFPGNGSAIFLEMNYNINHPLVVGVFYKTAGVKVQRPLIVLNESEGWNKVYINLTVPKYDTPSATDFQIFFGAQKEEGTSDALILLDNLKLVHFKTSK